MHYAWPSLCTSPPPSLVAFDRIIHRNVAAALLPRVIGHDPATMRVTTLREEKQFNTFLRLSSPSVIAALRESFPDLPEKPELA